MPDERAIAERFFGGEPVRFEAQSDGTGANFSVRMPLGSNEFEYLLEVRARTGGTTQVASARGRAAYYCDHTPGYGLFENLPNHAAALMERFKYSSGEARKVRAGIIRCVEEIKGDVEREFRQTARGTGAEVERMIA